MKIVFKGKALEGSRNEIICQLRQEGNLIQREIAELMGLTKSAISLILIKAGLGGSLEYPELEDEDLFLSMSNEEISDKFNIPLYLVQLHRRELKITPTRVNIGKRRDDLAKFLFGSEFEPGPMFDDTVIAIAKAMLTEKRAELIVDFLGGRLDTAAYKRVYRSDARKQLKEVIQSFDRAWEDEGVIQ